MFDLPPTVVQRAAARHGIVTSDELLDAGLSRHAINARSAGRLIHRVHNGVYRIAGSTDTFEARCVAACLADSTAVITGLSAARLWKFRHVPSNNVPEVLVRHDRTPITQGVRLRRTNVLEAEDVVLRKDGIRVASPVRTWFDCAHHLDDPKFEMLTEWVLDHHALIHTLYRTVRRFDTRGRRGLARVHRVLSQRSAWQRPAQSGLEVKVLTALRQHGIDTLVQQQAIRLPNGSLIHPDAGDPTIRWALEIDHITWHGGRFEAQRDKARDRQSRRVGWIVERVTDQALRDDFAREIAEVAESYWIRRREFAA